MPDLLGHFDDITRILVGVHPHTVLLRERDIIEHDHQYGSLSLALHYPDGSRLYVELEADCSGEPAVWLNYGFQYLGPDGSVRLRYDNVPHHHHLPNFPHHLHLQTGALLPEGPPPVRDVARAIGWYLDHPGEVWAPGCT